MGKRRENQITPIMIFVILAIMTALTLIPGCTQKTLKKDPYPSAIDNNYHSILIQVNADIFFGITTLMAPQKGASSFSILGIYKGTIHINSRECGINDQRYYSQTDFVTFTINPATDRCFINIIVSPDFDEQEAESKWKAISGAIVFKRDNHKFATMSHQMRTSDFTWFSFDIEKQNSRVFYIGCGEHKDEKASKGKQTLIISKNTPGICVLEGFVKSDSQDMTILSLISTYQPGFNKLPVPYISHSAGRWVFSSPYEVSLITINKRSFFSNIVAVTSLDLPALISFYTTKGRVSYCMINSTKEIKCLN